MFPMEKGRELQMALSLSRHEGEQSVTRPRQRRLINIDTLSLFTP